mmetsp:Transcript_25705/g.29455  ORF Transcript_25705/g.29455 Transcript_25705/m.29455 type:complete len:81 (-) Transcript_25705:40-282(-)
MPMGNVHVDGEVNDDDDTFLVTVIVGEVVSAATASVEEGETSLCSSCDDDVIMIVLNIRKLMGRGRMTRTTKAKDEASGL